MRREIASRHLSESVSRHLKKRDEVYLPTLKKRAEGIGVDRLQPIDPMTPKFPLHEPLARFFAADPLERVPISHIAELLGVTTERFRAMLAREGGHRRSDTLPWAEAAAYLFDAWPRAQLLDALGPDHARRVPPGFHPTRVTWSIPIFIVRAMEHQAAARGVHDYVTDLLFNEIQPETLLAFASDPAFLAAYNFPSD